MNSYKQWHGEELELQRSQFPYIICQPAFQFPYSVIFENDIRSSDIERYKAIAIHGGIVSFQESGRIFTYGHSPQFGLYPGPYDSDVIRGNEKRFPKLPIEKQLRFFCHCGEELWEGVRYNEIHDLTIAGVLLGLECSDCILKKIRSVK